MITLLKPNHWVNTYPEKQKGMHPVFKVDISFGDNAGTFICYAKLCRPDTAVLFNEAASWLLAKSCGVPVPQRAGIMMEAPVERLVGHALPSWVYQEKTVQAWVCQALPPRPSTIRYAGEIVHQELIKAEEGRRIMAFDEWTYNNDRNDDNIAHCPKTGWHAFDHSEAFGGHLWQHTADLVGIPATGLTTPLRRLKALWGSRESWLTICNALVFASSEHQTGFQQQAPRIAGLAQAQHGQEARDVVVNFLTDRASPTWLADQLSTI